MGLPSGPAGRSESQAVSQTSLDASRATAGLVGESLVHLGPPITKDDLSQHLPSPRRSKGAQQSKSQVDARRDRVIGGPLLHVKMSLSVQNRMLEPVGLKTSKQQGSHQTTHQKSCKTPKLLHPGSGRGMRAPNDLTASCGPGVAGQDPTTHCCLPTFEDLVKKRWLEFERQSSEYGQALSTHGGRKSLQALQGLLTTNCRAMEFANII